MAHIIKKVSISQPLKKLVFSLMCAGTLLSSTSAFAFLNLQTNLDLTVTPATSSTGASAAKLVIKSLRKNVILIKDDTGAAAVLKAGKIPAVFEVRYRGVDLPGTFDAAGAFTATVPLGSPFGPNYLIDYKASPISNDTNPGLNPIWDPIAPDAGWLTIFNTAPVIQELSTPNTFYQNEPTRLVGAVIGDREGHKMTVVIEGAPKHGKVVVNNGTGTATVLYTADAGYLGSDDFTIKATDALGAVSTKTIAVSVANAAVVGFKDLGLTYSIDPATSGSGTAKMVIGTVNQNAELIINPELAAAIADRGKVAVLLTPTFDVDLPSEQNAKVEVVNNKLNITLPLGTDPFDYPFHKLHFATKFGIKVGGTYAIGEFENSSLIIDNLPPSFISSVNDGICWVGSSKECSVTAVDANGGPVVVSVIRQPAGGTVTIKDNKAIYVPRSDFFGRSDSFELKATDSRGATNVTLEQFAVLPFQDADSSSFSVSVKPGVLDGGASAAKITIASTDPKVVFLDRGNPSAKNSLVAAGKVPVFVEGFVNVGIANENKVGTVDAAANTYSYLVPLGNLTTKPFVSYIVSSAYDNLALKWATSDITNKPPVLKDISAKNVYVSGQTKVQEIGVVATTSDVTNKVTYNITKQPSHGTVETKDGKALYSPTAGYFGDDSFSVTAVDSFGATASKTVAVSVVDGSPVSGQISSSLLSGYSPLVSQVSVKLTNASDSDKVDRVVWQQAFADVANPEWVDMKVSGMSPSLSIKSVGKLNVRAVIYTKLSDASFTTNPITFDVAKAPMPTFKLKANVNAEFAPAVASLILGAATASDAELMRGRKYIYDWKFPTGVIGKVSNGGATAFIDKPGTYPITVTASDEYNQTTTTEYVASLLEMKPFVFTIAPRKALNFERSPMTYMIRTTLKLGHPRDRVSGYTLRVNGKVYGEEDTRRMPGMVANLPAGTHTFEMTFTTNYGVTGKASTEVTVAENQAPVCTLKVQPLTRTTNALIFAKCNDADGKIRGYTWTVDGKPVDRSSNSLVLNMKGIATTDVTVKATDDSEATGEAGSTTVTGPTGDHY